MRPKTIFLDIDGTILFHYNEYLIDQIEQPPKILPGVKEKLEEWQKAGHQIILVTGRKSSMKEATISQLASCGILYDMLIMGITGGTRYLINDYKPKSDDETAIGISVKRNGGLSTLNLDEN